MRSRVAGAAEPAAVSQTPDNCATLFAQLDRPALKPLPAARYQFGEWEQARINIDYHIEVERHFYSVPYALVHQEVDVHVTGDTIEILHHGVRVGFACSLL